MTEPATGAEHRAAIVSAARRLVPLGLTRGTSGNLSARDGDDMLITPSAVSYDAMGEEDVVMVPLAAADATTSPREAAAAPSTRPRPSTEWRMHAGVLRARPDVGAVVHAHPPWATALSCLRRSIPAFHYMVAVAGGREIRCSRYATFGTAALAEAALEALEDRCACLLANHGILACAPDIERALALAVEVEALAGQYVRALSVGEPTLLDEAEMDEVLRAFESYGR